MAPSVVLTTRNDWTLENNAIAFRNKFYRDRGRERIRNADALPITGPTTRLLGMAGPIPADVGEYERQLCRHPEDMATINAACLQILTPTTRTKVYQL